MADTNRIIYATDLSSASLAAFPHAVHLALKLDAELTIFHVLPTPATTLLAEGGYVPQAVWDELYAGLRAHADTEMDRLRTQAIEDGVRVTTAIVDGGVAHEEIVRAANDLKADMLVLGTHGRTGVTKLFLGSVAARVVATASCPVLTVRAREDEAP
jgi:nucleotide-binding universal stress UspA family protein